MLEDKLKALSDAQTALEGATQKFAAKTGAADFNACHSNVEHYRELFQAATLADNPSIKDTLKKQYSTIDRAAFDQQMAAHQLASRVTPEVSAVMDNCIERMNAMTAELKKGLK